MPKDHGEMEFEFVETTQGGEFLASGKVVHYLKTYLARGDFDLAASLLASCAEGVGDELIAEIIEGGASKGTMKALAELFFRARDFKRAAYCAERAGEDELAAKYFEASYELEKASELYLKAGNLAKAAELLERDLSFDRAANLYMKMKDFMRAAENFERAGMYVEAGQLYMRMSKFDKAVAVLQRVNQMEQAYTSAVKLLGQVLEETGNERMAMQKYLSVVKSQPLDQSTLEIHYRLGKLCADKGFADQARHLMSSVLKVEPGHQGAKTVIGLLGSDMQERPDAVGQEQRGRGQGGLGKTNSPEQYGRWSTRERGKRTSVGFDLDPIDPEMFEEDYLDDEDVSGKMSMLLIRPEEIEEQEDIEDEPPPLDLGVSPGKKAKSKAAHDSKKPEKNVARRSRRKRTTLKKQTLIGFNPHQELLRRVSLFKEMSMDELRYLQSLCVEEKYGVGERLIEQNEPG
ncbi:MAG: hypothetical protein GXP49_08830, partial [Deltaproteobacteria bacterium]|nr:hypothetical protein [Deltaproteobacteria bacterium]